MRQGSPDRYTTIHAFVCLFVSIIVKRGREPPSTKKRGGGEKAGNHFSRDTVVKKLKLKRQETPFFMIHGNKNEISDFRFSVLNKVFVFHSFFHSFYLGFLYCHQFK